MNTADCASIEALKREVCAACWELTDGMGPDGLTLEFKDEGTGHAVVSAHAVLDGPVVVLNADDHYVHNLPLQSTSYKNGKIPVQEMAALLLGPDRSLEQRDIAAMLKRYAKDAKNENEVDVVQFRREFQNLARQRAIPIGEYKAPKMTSTGPSKGRGPKFEENDPYVQPKAPSNFDALQDIRKRIVDELAARRISIEEF